MYITLPLQKANKAEPTLALNPRGDVTRNPKQGYQWPPKRTCVYPKNFKKRKKRALILLLLAKYNKNVLLEISGIGAFYKNTQLT